VNKDALQDVRRLIYERLHRALDPACYEQRRLRRFEGRLQATIARAVRQDAPPGFREEKGFVSVAAPVLADRRTLLDPERLYVLWQAVRNVAHLRLAAAEVGSFRGGSAHFIASSFVALAAAEVEFHIFDTFEGHPAAAVGEHDTGQRIGGFGATTAESVRRYLSRFERIEIHVGDVSSQLGSLPERTYGLVHLDADLHKPTVESLEYFGQRLASGGIIILDDYWSPTCPGIRRAVEDYAPSRAEYMTWQPRTKQLVLIKR
jgi:hypothetical protein